METGKLAKKGCGKLAGNPQIVFVESQREIAYRIIPNKGTTLIRAPPIV